MAREALLVTHTGRPDVVEHARAIASDLSAAGFGVRVLAGEAADLALGHAASAAGLPAADGVEIIVALGGDGTLLRAAELARPTGTPLLGINLGRVGFLAEAEIDDVQNVVERVVSGAYDVDERLTIDVDIVQDGHPLGRTWALNEMALERAERERMLELAVSIDGHPVSRWGCDGLVCATPTGSTAYAFSAGGPVLWPEVQALLVVPSNAHALFSRPLVVGPYSTVTIESGSGVSAVASCDGRRYIAVPPGGKVTVRRGAQPVRVVRLSAKSFTDRLVAKFGLPVEGWRRRRG